MVFFMNKVDIFDNIIEIIANEADQNGRLIISNTSVYKELFTTKPQNSVNNKNSLHPQNKNVSNKQVSTSQQQNIQQAPHNIVNSTAQQQPQNYQQQSTTAVTNDLKSEFAQSLEKYDLSALKSITDNCTRCNLSKTRSFGVFGAGNAQADLMFIGEVPTANDNLSGTPFNNVDGELLAKMITAMQFNCDEIFITHTVKCHTKNERQPYPNEALKCLPYLERQIELVKPKVIVLLGGVALRYLLKLNDVNNYRGKWQTYKNIKVMPTFSPSYLNRYPNEKGKTWSDLKQVMQFFGKTAPK